MSKSAWKGIAAAPYCTTCDLDRLVEVCKYHIVIETHFMSQAHAI